MRYLLLLCISCACLTGNTFAFGSEPGVEAGIEHTSGDSGDFALTGLLYWKNHLCILAEDRQVLVKGEDASSVYLRLKSVEDELFFTRRQAKIVNWDELSELLSNLNEKDPLQWYCDYYHGLSLFAEGKFKEAEILLTKSLAKAKSMGDANYERSNLLVLYELNMCSNKPYEAVHHFREFYKIIEQQHQAKVDAVIAGSSDSMQRTYSINRLLFYGIIVFVLVALLSFIWLKWARYRLVLVSDFHQVYQPKNPLSFKTINQGSLESNVKLKSTDEALTDEEILVDEQKVELLAELRGKKILTEDDWVLFQQIFDQVHPEFLIHLRFRHKQITPSEEKLACLIRLHFSTKEIARLMAVSTHAVNMGRYRLKKRFGLSGTITLEEYLMGF